jgi:hypothetical protein
LGGEAKRRERIRQEAAQRRPELEQHLREQIDLLRLHGDLFDSGRRVAALPLAAELRVLLHDTSRSHSVCELLGIKSSLRFRDTAEHINPQNLISNPGLVLMKMTSGIGVEWIAPLGMERPHGRHPDLGFRAWWTGDVIKDMAGHTWSRKDFVLHLANKKGGAHVDPLVTDEAIEALENDNTLGWSYPDPISRKTMMMAGPIPPSIRQIAFEVVETLNGYQFQTGSSADPPQTPSSEGF